MRPLRGLLWSRLMNDIRKHLFANWLFDGESWHENSLLTLAAGKILSVENVDCCPPDAERHQILLPGMPNLHSHSFQRAFAGDIYLYHQRISFIKSGFQIVS